MDEVSCDVSALRLVKPAGTPPPVRSGPAGGAMPPEDSAWDAAAQYEVPFKAGDTMLEIAYEGDMARLYADGRLVQDDFWKGRPLRYALRRLPKGTKRLVLKVMPRGAGWEDKVYVDRARDGSSADVSSCAARFRPGRLFLSVNCDCCNKRGLRRSATQQ